MVRQLATQQKICTKTVDRIAHQYTPGIPVMSSMTPRQRSSAVAEMLPLPAPSEMQLPRVVSGSVEVDGAVQGSQVTSNQVEP